MRIFFFALFLLNHSSAFAVTLGCPEAGCPVETQSYLTRMDASAIPNAVVQDSIASQLAKIQKDNATLAAYLNDTANEIHWYFGKNEAEFSVKHNGFTEIRPSIRYRAPHHGIVFINKKRFDSESQINKQHFFWDNILFNFCMDRISKESDCSASARTLRMKIMNPESSKLDLKTLVQTTILDKKKKNADSGDIPEASPAKVD
jgi:hypothetical protein